MRSNGNIKCGFLLLITGLWVCPASWAEQPSVAAVVENASSDGSSLDIVIDGKTPPEHFRVNETVVQEKLKGLKLQKGDQIMITSATDTEGHKTVQMLDIRSVAVTKGRRTWVFIWSALIYFLLGVLLSWGHPLKLVIGEDGRYSNSKFQLALWFGILIVTYLTTTWLRATQSGFSFWGGVNIPQNLLLLSGMSAFTFGAAKGITTNKVQSALAAGNPAPKPVALKPRFLTDLTNNDGGRLDLGDFQMLVITLLAVVMYLILVFMFLGSIEMRSSVSLPDVDTTILAAFGLGNGAYLTKKAVGSVGDT